MSELDNAKESDFPEPAAESTELSLEDVLWAAANFISCNPDGRPAGQREIVLKGLEWAIDQLNTQATAPAPAAGGDLISREEAAKAACFYCANPARYRPAEPIEGSGRLFHFRRADNSNAGQCNAQAMLALPAARPAPAAAGDAEIRKGYIQGLKDAAKVAADVQEEIHAAALSEIPVSAEEAEVAIAIEKRIRALSRLEQRQQ